MACDALVAWEHGLRALADGCAGRLLVVNIGSNVGDFDASRLNDMCESGRRALTRLLAAPDLLTLLVEPNPTAYRELERAAAGQRSDRKVHRTVQAAVCPAQSGTVPFYAVSEAYARDYPDSPLWARGEINSLSYNNTHRGLWFAKPRNVTRKRWRTGEAARYVETLRVRCLTPQALLREAGLSADAVDVLALDLEGLDGEVLRAFLALPGFRPRLVIFESNILLQRSPTLTQRLFRSLSRRGYTLAAARPNHVAWLSQEMRCRGMERAGVRGSSTVQLSLNK